MGKIHLLSDTLISQIAAGEVIERPASVLKELLENSLDAGATHCSIEIEGGGAKLISVSDNGCGMDKIDARLAFERHATSKIKELEDLSNIRSFGFRGEALAAIASVAMVTMRTRLRNLQGTEGISREPVRTDVSVHRYVIAKSSESQHVGSEISYAGGKFQSEGPVGCPPGTEIVVRNLFFNTPARRKFLKSEITELNNIIATASHIALAYPSTGFIVRHNGKIIFDIASSQHLEERIAAMLGRNFIEEMLAVSFSAPTIKISGSIGKPGMHLSSKRHQYLFMNGRDVNDPLISRAVCDAYGSRLPGRVYPMFILFIEIDPKEVDVNVHPRKLAVKFLDPQKIYKAVVQMVEEALDGDVIASPSVAWRGNREAPPRGYPIQHAIEFNKQFLTPTKNQTGLTVPTVINYQLSATSILGQIANSYILVFDEEGLAIIDQHAAHERIMYEKLLAQMQTKVPDSQQLLVPVPIDCSVEETVVLEDALPMLQNMGFTFDEWSGRRFLITACPVSLRQENFEKIFRDFFDSFLEDFKKEKKLLPENLLKMLACKAAVKFGMKLSPEEQYSLLEELPSTPNNATCPHGRPVKVLISFEELERRFYRRK